MLLMDILQQGLIELTWSCTPREQDVPAVYSRQCQQWQKAAKMPPPWGHLVLGKGRSYEHPLAKLQPAFAALGLASHSVEGARAVPTQARPTTQPYRRCQQTT